MTRHLRESTDPIPVENDQISKKLDPQGLGSLLRIWMNNFALYVNMQDAQDQSLKECNTGR